MGPNDGEFDGTQHHTPDSAYLPLHRMLGSGARLLRNAAVPSLSRSLSAAPAVSGVIVSPAAGNLLRNNPSLSTEGLASKATHRTPTGFPILTKVTSSRLMLPLLPFFSL